MLFLSFLKSHYYSDACLFSKERDRKVGSLNERRSWEGLGGDGEKGNHIHNILYEKSIFNKRKINYKKRKEEKSGLRQ